MHKVKKPSSNGDGRYESGQKHCSIYSIFIITRREDHRTCTVDESPTFPVHEYVSIVLPTKIFLRYFGYHTK